MSSTLTLVFAASFALFSTHAWAAPQRQAILFGGNCDAPARHPTYPGNMFLKDVTNEAVALKNRKWDVTPLFGGPLERCTLSSTTPRCQVKEGQTPPAECCAEGMTPNDPTWSTHTLSAALSIPSVEEGSKTALFNALDQAAKLPAGSELLLSIDTHGGPRTAEGSHDLCLSDGTTMRVDDPGLLQRLAKIKAANIQLGFIDASCFDGDSKRVLSTYGCVVTSQTSNRVSWGGGAIDALNDILSDPTKAPLSLETVFLRDLARNAKNPSKYEPQITGYSHMEHFDDIAARLIVDSVGDLGIIDNIKTWDDQADRFDGISCHEPEADFASLSRFLTSIQSELSAFELWKTLSKEEGWTEKSPTELLNEIRREEAALRKARMKMQNLSDRRDALENKVQTHDFRLQFDSSFKGDEPKIVQAFSAVLNTSSAQTPFSYGKIDKAQMNLLTNSGSTIPIRDSNYTGFASRVLAQLKKDGFASSESDADLTKNLAHLISQSVNQTVRSENTQEITADTAQINALTQQLKSSDAPADALQASISKLQLFEYLKLRQASRGAATERDPLNPESPAPGPIRSCSDFKLTAN
jgi:hypothetical protein